MQTITLKNNRQFVIRKLVTEDFLHLQCYLQQLNAATKKRFGPHPFDLHSIESFYNDETNHGYIAVDLSNTSIAAYAIIKQGYLWHDKDRLQLYGLTVDTNTDCTFAASVSDELQGQGLGTHLFHFVVNNIKENACKKIILWGGVQAGNENAIHYYKKNGFTQLGMFEYNGWNIDMIAIIE